MICREVKWMFNGPFWLLVSQVEHARLSAELARHWIAPSSRGVLFDTNGDDALTSEVLTAIEHHDDGWERWERSPEIDPALGRPLSYRGEVALKQALAIWNDSIAAARGYGPLAGMMVARHFLYLQKDSDSRGDRGAARWRTQMEANCATWLGEWLAKEESRGIETANRAIAHLQFFDFLSLWLCCDCPLVGEVEANTSAPFTLSSFTGDLGPFQFTPMSAEGCTTPSGDFPCVGYCPVVVEPWPFDVDVLSLETSGMLVPNLNVVQLWRQMVACSTPWTLAWEFVPP